MRLTADEEEDEEEADVGAVHLQVPALGAAVLAGDPARDPDVAEDAGQLREDEDGEGDAQQHVPHGAEEGVVAVDARLLLDWAGGAVRVGGHWDAHGGHSSGRGIACCSTVTAADWDDRMRCRLRVARRSSQAQGSTALDCTSLSSSDSSCSARLHGHTEGCATLDRRCGAQGSGVSEGGAGMRACAHCWGGERGTGSSVARARAHACTRQRASSRCQCSSSLRLSSLALLQRLDRVAAGACRGGRQDARRVELSDQLRTLAVGAQHRVAGRGVAQLQRCEGAHSLLRLELAVVRAKASGTTIKAQARRCCTSRSSGTIHAYATSAAGAGVAGGVAVAVQSSRGTGASQRRRRSRGCGLLAASSSCGRSHNSSSLTAEGSGSCTGRHARGVRLARPAVICASLRDVLLALALHHRPHLTLTLTLAVGVGGQRALVLHTRSGGGLDVRVHIWRGGHHIAEGVLHHGVAVGPHVRGPAVLHDHDGVRLRQLLQRVRDEDDEFAPKQAAQQVAHDVLAHEVVDGGQGRVQQQDVGVGVGGASEGDARFLPARHVDAALSNHGLQSNTCKRRCSERRVTRRED